MADDLVQSVKARRVQISAALEAARTPPSLAAVKKDIIALFKQVDGAITDLTAVKAEIRTLVDRYKQAEEQGEAGGGAAPGIETARPVVQADHIGASTFIGKGWSLISLGDYDGAIQALAKALALSPGEVEAESLLGWAQMLKEDYDDALATLQKVLMKEPGNSLARINLGYVCLKKKIYGEAIEHLSKAIRMANDPKATLYANFYLGLVYLQREMFEDAENFFKKTLDIGPNMIEAYYELGRAQWLCGNADAAKATWQAGFAANKFNPWGKKCRDMLATVEAGGAPPRP